MWCESWHISSPMFLLGALIWEISIMLGLLVDLFGVELVGGRVGGRERWLSGRCECWWLSVLL